MQAKSAVVVVHDGIERGEAAIVIEPAPGVGPEAPQGRRAIAAIRRPVGLEVINANLGAGVHVPARLRVRRGEMAASALLLSVDAWLATIGGVMVVGGGRRSGSSMRQSIELEVRQLV